MVSDLFRIYRRRVRPWPLTRVVLQYWLRMASGRLGSRTRVLRCDLSGTRFELRDHASDLFVFREVFVRGAYDYDYVSILGDDPQTVVDLGANIGAFAALVSSRWPSARVLCVEPDPDNLTILARNAQARAWMVVAAAVGPSKQSVILHRSEWWSSATIMETVANQRAARPYRPEAQTALPSIVVPCATLPDLTAQHGIGDIDILKIDIEGAELELLESLSADDFNHIRSLVIDVHDKYVDGNRLHALLQAVGMQPRGLSEGTWLYVRGTR